MVHIPLFLKIMVISLNLCAFVILFINSDSSTRFGRMTKYICVAMVIVDCVIVMRHMGLINWY
jgi:hypothetical protein